jgi:hypothetical protein
MRYVDHYEIEERHSHGEWVHVGNLYPRYEWRITRPWYLLGLVRRPVIVNDKSHAAHVARAYASGALARLHAEHPGVCVRVWEWHRGWFGILTHRLVLELP